VPDIALDAQNQYGETALLAATRGGSVAVVRELLNAGASAQLRNTDCASAIDVAKSRGHAELVQLLARR
jgi:ankyrin repeat protein